MSFRPWLVLALSIQAATDARVPRQSIVAEYTSLLANHGIDEGSLLMIRSYLQAAANATEATPAVMKLRH